MRRGAHDDDAHDDDRLLLGKSTVGAPSGARAADQGRRYRMENASCYVQETLELGYAGTDVSGTLPLPSGTDRGGRPTRRGIPGALPPELRPRERLLAVGAGALSGAEILAIMLGGAAVAGMTLFASSPAGFADRDAGFA